MLAIVQVFRGDEPAPAPAPAVEASAEPKAAPRIDVAAAPVERPVGAAERRSLRVHGEVTNPRGGRIPGVRIAAVGRTVAGVTDPSGAYELHLEVAGEEPPALRFSTDGYQEKLVELERAGMTDEELRLDVRLEPAPGAVVSGTLTNERGSPIPGETIQLASVASNARYAGVSGADGTFFVPGVAPGHGYSLSVRPTSGHADYQTGLDVGPDGLSLDVALRALSTARVRGRLVDAEGRPIPDLPLSVVSGQALRRSLPTTTDAEGHFVVDEVPTGHLIFLANVPERVVIGGVMVAPGSDPEVLLRVDWGDQELFGRVVDEEGRPLEGVELELSWSHVSEGVSGRSNRSTATDAQGNFAFRRLADGIHQLDVRAPGYREVQLDYEVTSQSPGLELELEPAREEG